MCLIIYSPKGREVPYRNLVKGFRANPDGAGLMWKNKKGGISFKKGFMDFKDFLECYNKVKYKELGIHFRLATHGAIEPANCHPFNVAEPKEVEPSWGTNCDEMCMHNGIIHSIPTPKNYNDSKNFCEKSLLALKDLEREPLVDYLEKVEGGSKFLIFKRGEKPILAGYFTELEDGNKYSNLWWEYRYLGGVY